MQNWLAWITTDKPKSNPRRLIGHCADHIASLPPLSKKRRIDIYAFAYFERLMDALSDDFEATYKRVGDRAFRKLLSEYLKKHPSRSTSVSYVGAQLPAFLKKHALSRK